uniref:Ankyrin repeat domain 22 n=1 Tax=Sphaeramia orbicularis TaxID=375764 RepID=A0A673CI28_9TELE
MCHIYIKCIYFNKIPQSSPLIAACRHGNVHVVRYLLDNGADKQRTCLHYASRRTVSMVNYLMIIVLMPILLLGYFLLVTANQTPACKGNTALHYLCQRKTTRLVPLLLHRNAEHVKSRVKLEIKEFSFIIL